MSNHRSTPRATTGAAATGVEILEYGDYECPYSRKASPRHRRGCRARTRSLRFVFRHFPLTDIHPHALAAAGFAEAAAAYRDASGRCTMLLFRPPAARSKSDDLSAYATSASGSTSSACATTSSATSCWQRVARRPPPPPSPTGAQRHAHAVSQRPPAHGRLRAATLLRAALGRAGANVSANLHPHRPDRAWSTSPETTAGCEDCLATGGRWLHLRMCHDLRQDRLLRLLAEPSCEQARARGRTSPSQ